MITFLAWHRRTPSLQAYSDPHRSSDAYWLCGGIAAIDEVNPGRSKTNCNFPKALDVENIGARA